MKTKTGSVKESARPAVNVKTPTRFNLHKILLPTDFSEQSRKATQYAIAFARQFGAVIVPLHVVEPLPYNADFGYGSVTLQQPNELLLTKAREHLKGLSEDQSGELFAPPLLRSGTPHHEIAVCAREIAADLIIIATHGYSGLDHVLLGSVAERVVRHAPCPVLIVREKEHEFIAAS